MMPTWKQCLQAIVLLAIAGFALVVLSGFWPVMAIFCLTAVIAGFCRGALGLRR